MASKTYVSGDNFTIVAKLAGNTDKGTNTADNGAKSQGTVHANPSTACPQRIINAHAKRPRVHPESNNSTTNGIRYEPSIKTLTPNISHTHKEPTVSNTAALIMPNNISAVIHSDS